jgi:hypothetical protein
VSDSESTSAVACCGALRGRDRTDHPDAKAQPPPMIVGIV